VTLSPQTSVHPPAGGPTPGQTIGPFFRFGMAWMDAHDLVEPGAPGAVVVTGRIFDGDGVPLRDAMVEIWQADADGSFDGGEVAPGTWSGFGRALTDADGRYRFTTVRPGAVGPGAAPHIDVTIFARGLLQRLVTRMYLPGHPANDSDPVLTAICAGRSATLVARAKNVDGVEVLAFDIHLQGPRETVFFAW
jgi:protocatechuate 3,4-dioxygenase alpha subunit